MAINNRYVLTHGVPYAVVNLTDLAIQILQSTLDWDPCSL